jgi:hypothetical protein
MRFSDWHGCTNLWRPTSTLILLALPGESICKYYSHGERLIHVVENQIILFRKVQT